MLGYENDNKRIIGIDWGMAKIGLALGDSLTKMASPFKVVKGLPEVLEVINSEGVEKIVLGQPLKMSGQAELMTEFNKFHQSLLETTRLPVELIDERLTTAQAGQLMHQDKKQSADEDAIAAMLILQTYFDQH